MTEQKQCPAPRRAVLVGWDNENKRSFVYMPGCKRWSCPVCGERNRKQWTARIYSGVVFYRDQGTGDWTFCTLTSHEKLKTFEQTWAVWPKAWGKLSTRMRRAFPGIRYALVPEQHNDGRVHTHFLASYPINTRWLKDHARASGLGYQAEGKPVTQPGLAAYYVAKYLSKTLTAAKWPKNTRRIRTSRGWPQLPENGLYGEYHPVWQKVALGRKVSEADLWAASVKTMTGFPVQIIVG
jgi:hypothetical protein